MENLHVAQVRLTTASLRDDSFDPEALREQVRHAREQAARARAAIEKLQEVVRQLQGELR